MTPDDDDETLKARLDKLGQDLKSKKPAPLAAPPSTDARTAYLLGSQAASQFIAAIVVGGGVGFGLDWLLHTKPAFTIVFFLLGFGAGFWGVIQTFSPKGGP